MHRYRYSLVLALGLLLGGFHVPASDQSNHVSDASVAIPEASVEVPVAVYDALKAGAHFAVTGVQASARGTALTHFGRSSIRFPPAGRPDRTRLQPAFRLAQDQHGQGVGGLGRFAADGG